MLADRHQNWNHQHWSHVIFGDESSVSHRPREFHLLRGYNNPLAFQEHDGKLAHVHYSCRGWLWTHQQTVQEISADGPSFTDCVPTCGGSGDGQESVWDIGLDVLSDSQLLLNIYRPCGQIYTARLISPTLMLDTERKLFRLMIRRRVWSFLCDRLQ